MGSAEFYATTNNPFSGQADDAHHGADYPHDAGTPIPSWDDGVVAYVGYGTELGNFISIRRRRDSSYMGHSHLLEPPTLAVGDPVAFDQDIGLVGTTGKSTGPHDHATLSLNLYPWSGEWFDPAPHIAASIAFHTQKENNVRIIEDAGPTGQNAGKGTLYVAAAGRFEPWPAKKYANDRAILVQAFGPIESFFTTDIAAVKSACLMAAPTLTLDAKTVAAIAAAVTPTELIIAGTARPTGKGIV